MLAKIKNFILTSVSLPDLGTLESKAGAISNLVLKSVLLVLTILAIIIVSRAIVDKSYIVKPLAVPRSLVDIGYTGDVFSYSVIDKLDEMSDVFGESVSKPGTDNMLNDEGIVLDESIMRQRQEVLQMEIGGLGVKFNALIESVKHLMGQPQNYISGDVILIDSSLTAHLRMTGHSTLMVSVPFRRGNIGSACDSISIAAAEYVMKELAPVKYMYYCLYNKKYREAATIAHDLLGIDSASAKHCYNILGLVAKNSGNINLGILYLKKSIERDTNFAIAYHNLATCYSKEEEYSLAITCYKKAIQLDKYNSKFYRSLGLCYVKQTNYNRAIEQLKIAISMENRNVVYLRTLATIYRKAKMYEEALDLYRLCLEIEDNSARVYNNIAMVYQSQKDYITSVIYAKKSIELDSTYFYAYSTLAEDYAKLDSLNLFIKYAETALKYKYPEGRFLKNEIIQDYIDKMMLDSILPSRRNQM
jgi:tetratricopeptide (TPR) repeat protein